MFALAVQFQKLASLGKFDFASGRMMSLELVVRPPANFTRKLARTQILGMQGCSQLLSVCCPGVWWQGCGAALDGGRQWASMWREYDV